MKQFIFLALSVLLASTAQAEEPVVVSRGEHNLTLVDIDARMQRFPEHERAQFVRNTDSIGRLLERLINDKMLAAEARELGLDQDPLIQRDLELAVNEVLAIHRLNQFYARENLPDFQQLARERYLADPDSFAESEQYHVEHVLIALDGRTQDEALELANELANRAEQDPEQFPTLVEGYSDDPGKQANQGRYLITGQNQDEFVPEFVAAALALAESGQKVSEPVQTAFGYHILHLYEFKPRRPRSFEEVQPELSAKLEHDYRDHIRGDHISSLRRRYEEVGNTDLLISLPARYGGRPETSP